MAMRNFARAMVLTTVIALITAMIAAHDTLSHGSGTYFATFMFVPFVVAPGILVWFKPDARSFTIWAVCSTFASTIYLAAGSPYSWERELIGWHVIAAAMYTAIFISVVGSTIMAWTLAASRRDALPDSSRARRIRSIARLAPIVGATAIVTALIMVERNHETVVFVIGSFIAFTCAPAPFVYRRPSRGAAFMWMAWSVPYAALALLLQLSDDDHVPLMARVFMLTTGTLGALLVAVLPITAIFASGDVEQMPEAREVD
jgi:hypothetical protein